MRRNSTTLGGWFGTRVALSIALLALADVLMHGTLEFHAGVAQGAEFYVALGGKDTNPGTKDLPFASLERARAAVRSLKSAGGLPEGGVVVWVRGGLYLRTAPFDLGVQDSGEAGKPVIYSGYPGEQIRITGGVLLDLSRFSPLTSASATWNRLDPVARGQVRETSLPWHGITDYGTLKVRGFNGSVNSSALELFGDGQPLPLARWPDPDQHEVPSNPADPRIAIYGQATPDITGAYVSIGLSDGVNAYQRSQPVNGKTYYFYRMTWTYLGKVYTAWFLTTQKSGYPSNSDPWWYRYDQGFGALLPYTANGAAGSPTTANPSAINHGFASIAQAINTTTYTFSGDRLQRWTTATEPWMHGFFMYSWADFHMPVASLDPVGQSITLASAPLFGISDHQPFYAENMLEEITRPGEWFLDRGSGQLYVWLPSGISELQASTWQGPLVRLQGSAHLILQDMILENTRGTLAQILTGTRNTLRRCELRNAGTCAVTVTGFGNSLERCLIHDTGDDGARLAGGERKSLTKGLNTVKNSEFHHFSRWSWTYHPAIWLSDCGQKVSHNLFHQAPHSAVIYWGNEHTLEFNDVHNVCQFSSDAGVFYTGRDWGYRGNLITTNFIHDISTWLDGYGVHGAYLDDCVSGIEVTKNVFYRITGKGVMNGGGRDNLITNNLMVGCGAALSGDNRGTVHINNIPGDSWNMLERLTYGGILYQQNPWSSAYPLLAAIPNDWNQVSAPSALWREPQGCVFSRNLGYANTKFMVEQVSSGDGVFNKYKEIANNIPDQDPLFVNEGSGDLTLRPESPALGIPGFVDIPFKQIGIEPEPAAPTVRIQTTSASGAAPLDAVLSGVASAVPAGAISLWLWDFGDGTSASGQTIARHYEDPGLYQVTLRALDSNGRTGMANLLLAVVKPNHPPVISSSSPVSPVSVSVGTTQAFRVEAWDGDGEVLGYSWQLDGTPLSAAGDTLNYRPTPAEAGSHTLAVIVTDGKAGHVQQTWRVLVTVPSGAVLWWKLDETQGSVAADATGQGNAGDLAGGPLWTAGIVGGALTFKGAKQQVNLANVAGLPEGNPQHTVAAWVKLDALPRYRAWLMVLGQEGSGAHHWLIDHAGRVQMGVWNGPRLASVMPVGQWRHLAMTFDGTRLKAYLDGVLVGSQAGSFNLKGVPLAVAKGQLNEGGFAGLADDVWIFNRALNAAEIAGLAGAAEPGAAGLGDEVEGGAVGPEIATHGTFQVEKAAVRLYFAKQGSDRIRLRGLVPLPADFESEGRELVLSLGTIEQVFVLDRDGKGVNEAGKVRLQEARGRKAYQEQPARLVVTLTGDFAEALAEFGLTDGEANEREVFLLITVRCSEVSLVGGRGGDALGPLPMRYNAKAGTKGVAVFLKE